MFNFQYHIIGPLFKEFHTKTLSIENSECTIRFKEISDKF